MSDQPNPPDTPRTDRQWAEDQRALWTSKPIPPSYSKVNIEFARELERENNLLRAEIRHLGEMSDTCTYDTLKEICNYCACGRADKDQPTSQPCH